MSSGKGNVGLEQDDAGQSTGSVLGELIKDLDLPALETLIESPAASLPGAENGAAIPQGQVQAQFSLVQGADGTQELQVRGKN